MAQWLDFLGVDAEPIIELGNQWIALGDSLEERVLTLTDAVHQDMVWNGAAAIKAKYVFDAQIVGQLHSARDSAYQIGGAINYYAQQLIEANHKAEQEYLKNIIVQMFGFLVGFLSLFLPGILAGLFGALAKMLGSIINVIDQVLSRMGTLGTLAGYTGVAVTGAAVQLGIDAIGEAIGDAATGLPFHIDWKNEGINMAVAAGGGVIFHGMENLGPKFAAKLDGNIHTPPAEGPKAGNAPNVTPDNLPGTGGHGPSVSPPKVGVDTPHPDSVVTPGKFGKNDVGDVNPTTSKNNPVTDPGNRVNAPANPHTTNSAKEHVAGADSAAPPPQVGQNSAADRNIVPQGRSGPGGDNVRPDLGGGHGSTRQSVPGNGGRDAAPAPGRGVPDSGPPVTRPASTGDRSATADPPNSHNERTADAHRTDGGAPVTQPGQGDGRSFTTGGRGGSSGGNNPERDVTLTHDQGPVAPGTEGTDGRTSATGSRGGEPPAQTAAGGGNRSGSGVTGRPDGTRDGAGGGDPGLPSRTPEQVGETGRGVARDGGLGEGEAKEWGDRFAAAHRDEGPAGVAKVHEQLTDRMTQVGVDRALRTPHGARPEPTEHSARGGTPNRNENVGGGRADRAGQGDPGASSRTPEQVGETGRGVARDGGLSEAEAKDWGDRFAAAHRDEGPAGVAKVHEQLTDRMTQVGVDRALRTPQGARPEPGDPPKSAPGREEPPAGPPSRTPQQVGDTAKGIARDGGLSEAEAKDWGDRFAAAHQDEGPAGVTRLHEQLTDRMTQVGVDRALKTPHGARPDPADSGRGDAGDPGGEPGGPKGSSGGGQGHADDGSSSGPHRHGSSGGGSSAATEHPTEHPTGHGTRVLTIDKPRPEPLVDGGRDGAAPPTVPRPGEELAGAASRAAPGHVEQRPAGGASGAGERADAGAGPSDDPPTTTLGHQDDPPATAPGRQDDLAAAAGGGPPGGEPPGGAGTSHTDAGEHGGGAPDPHAHYGDAETIRAKATEWQGFKDTRDADYNDRFTMAERFGWKTRDLDVEHELTIAEAKFRQDDLFDGRYLPEDGAAAREVGEGFHQDLRDGFASVWKDTDGNPDADGAWSSTFTRIRDGLPDRFALFSERERQLQSVNSRFDQAVEQFRKDDLFGGAHLPEERIDEHGIRYDEATDTFVADPAKAGPLGKLRAEVRADVAKAMNSAWRDAGGRPAGNDARKLETTLGEIHDDLPGRLAHASDQERQVQHGERAFDRAYDDWSGDIAGGGRLGDETLAQVREEFTGDLRRLHDDLHAQAADHPDGWFGRTWERTNEHLVETLPNRFAHGEFRERILARGDRALQDAITRHEDADPGAYLGDEGRERLSTEWTKAVEAAVDEHWSALPGRGFRGHGPQEEPGDPQEGPGASWNERFEDLAGTLPHRIAHEFEKGIVLRQAAGDFGRISGHPDDLARGFDVSGEPLDRLANDFREDTITEYDRIWGPEGTDSKAWLAHEAEHEGVFGARLTAWRETPLHPGDRTPQEHVGEPAATGDPAEPRPTGAEDVHAAPPAGDAPAPETSQTAHSGEPAAPASEQLQVQAQVVRERPPMTTRPEPSTAHGETVGTRRSEHGADLVGEQEQARPPAPALDTPPAVTTRFTEALADVTRAAAVRDEAHQAFDTQLATHYPQPQTRPAAPRLEPVRQWFADRWTAAASEAGGPEHLATAAQDQLKAELADRLPAPAAAQRQPAAHGNPATESKYEEEFAAALRVEGEWGYKADLAKPEYTWNQAATRHYTDRLDRLQQQYAEDRAAADALGENKDTEVERLNQGVLHAALRLRAETGPMTAAIRNFHERTRDLSGDFVRDRELKRDTDLLIWYGRQQSDIVRRFSDALEAQGLGAQAHLERDFGRQVTALRGVVSSRLAASQEFRRLYDQAGPRDWSSSATWTWVEEQVQPLREAFIQIHAAGPEPSSSTTRAEDWRTAATRADQGRLDATYGDLLTQARTRPPHEEPAQAQQTSDVPRPEAVPVTAIDPALQAEYRMRLGEALDRAAASFASDVDDAGRALLDAFGARGTQPSAAALAAVRSRLGRELEAAVAEEHGSATAQPAPPELWSARFETLAARLPGELAAEAAREAATVRAREAVDEAVRAWAETSSGRGATFLRRFGLQQGAPPTGVHEAVRNAFEASIGARFDQFFDGVPARVLPARLREWEQAVTAWTGRLPTWLALEAARRAASTEARRAFDERLDSLDPGHALSADQMFRLKSGFDARAQTAFADVFAGSTGEPADLTTRAWAWEERLAALTETLPDHVAFESVATAGLRDAAASFQRLAREHEIDAGRLEEIAAGYRADWFDAFRRVWGPADLHPAWLDHEKAYGDAFAAGPAGYDAAETAGRPLGSGMDEGTDLAVRRAQEILESLSPEASAHVWDEAATIAGATAGLSGLGDADGIAAYLNDVFRPRLLIAAAVAVDGSEAARDLARMLAEEHPAEPAGEADAIDVRPSASGIGQLLQAVVRRAETALRDPGDASAATQAEEILESLGLPPGQVTDAIKLLVAGELHGGHGSRQDVEDLAHLLSGVAGNTRKPVSAPEDEDEDAVVDVTDLDGARRTLGKQSDSLYAKVMDQARTIVRELSGLLPSQNDLGQVIADADRVRILLAAHIVRAGTEGIEDVARSLLSATSAAAPSRWAADLTVLANLAVIHQYGDRLPVFTGEQVVTAYHKLPDLARVGPLAEVAGRVMEQLTLGAITRVLGGAIGAEFETVIRLNAGAGELPYATVLADNEELGFRLVVDHRNFYIDTEGTYYSTKALFDASGKTLRERQDKVPVVEFVTRPGGVPGESRKWTIQQIIGSMRTALTALSDQSKDGPVSITDWLPETAKWKDRRDDVKAEILPIFTGPNDDVTLFAQYTVDIRPTELYGALQDVLANNEKGTNSARFLQQGLEFGTEIAREFAGLLAHVELPASAVDVLDEVEPVAAVRGFLALVYPHVAANLRQLVMQGKNLTKNWVLASSRTAFAAIRELLPADSQQFLQLYAENIEERLIKKFRAGSPDFDELVRKRNLNPDEVDYLAQPLATGQGRTIGDYLNNALLPLRGELVDQYQGIGIVTNFRTTRDGQAVVEFRGWGPYPIGISQVPEVIEPLGTMLADRESRARWKQARTAERGPQLVDAVRLLTNAETDTRAAAFKALGDGLVRLEPIWRSRHAEAGTELLPASDIATILLGLRALGVTEPASPAAVAEAIQVLRGLGDRLNQLVEKNSATIQGWARDALERLKAVGAFLLEYVPPAAEEGHAETGGSVQDVEMEPAAAEQEAAEDAAAWQGFPPDFWDGVARAGEVLGGVTEEERNAALRQADTIAADHHEPLPFDLTTVPAGQRQLYEGIVQVIAAQLGTAGPDSARSLSSWLADRLGTRRRTFGAPPGHFRQPVDVLEIGGGGQPSSVTLEDLPPSPAAEEPDVLARARRLSEVLPEKLWWRLYLDPRDHRTAARRLPADPGFLYDTEESPGFKKSMVDAYQAILDAPVTQRLDSAAYKRMHELVTANLNEQFDWSGKQSNGFAPPTEFPLRNERPHPEVLTEMVGDRPLLVMPFEYMQSNADRSKPDPVAIVNTFQLSNVIIQTVYAQSQVPGLVDTVLDRYYDEIGQAQTGHGRLRAMGRVVRALQIIHPFGDANRRLNVHLLLPKLLLEQGFQPVVRPDMAMLFQGGYSADEIADALLEGQQDDLAAPIEILPEEAAAEVHESVVIRDWVWNLLAEAGPVLSEPMSALADALYDFEQVVDRQAAEDAAHEAVEGDPYDVALERLAGALAIVTGQVPEDGEAAGVYDAPQPEALVPAPVPVPASGRAAAAVAEAALDLVGALRWRGASSPDPASDWLVGEVTRWGHLNHFARWIRGTGPEPNEWSTMNCWEMVLFAAYRAGAVDKAWLDRIHAEASNAAVTALAEHANSGSQNVLGGVPVARDAYGQLASVGEVAYDATLLRGMYQGELSEYPVGAEHRPVIPAGDLIFFNGSNHVGLSLGGRDDEGRQLMLSLWAFPAHRPAGPYNTTYTYGVLQMTSVEELIEAAGMYADKIEFATPAWATPAATPAAGIGDAGVQDPPAGEESASHADDATAAERPSVVPAAFLDADPRRDLVDVTPGPQVRQALGTLRELSPETSAQVWSEAGTIVRETAGLRGLEQATGIMAYLDEVFRPRLLVAAAIAGDGPEAARRLARTLAAGEETAGEAGTSHGRAGAEVSPQAATLLLQAVLHRVQTSLRALDESPDIVASLTEQADDVLEHLGLPPGRVLDAIRLLVMGEIHGDGSRQDVDDLAQVLAGVRETTDPPAPADDEVITDPDQARVVLGKLPERRYAEVMDQARTIVGDLSGHLPSGRDRGGEVSDVDAVRLLVAARILRAGAQGAEEFAAARLSAAASSGPSRWTADLTAFVNLALIHQYAEAPGFTNEQVVAAYHKLPDTARRGPMPQVADRVAERLLTGGLVRAPGGAIGGEFETVIRITAGPDLPYATLLADNERLGYKTVIDHRNFYVDTEGTYYATKALFEASGKRLKEFLSHVPVVEFVTRPGAVPGENRQWTIQQIIRWLRDAIDALGDKSRKGPVTIEDWLPSADGWEHHLDDLGDVVADVLPIYAGESRDIALFAQYTVDVRPAELHGALQDVLANNPQGTNAARFLQDGLDFGTEIALWFAENLTGVDLPAVTVDVLDEIEAVSAVRGFMALVYPHIAANLRRISTPTYTYTKNWVLAASRTAFAALRELLPREARWFLEAGAEEIRLRLVEKYLAGHPGFDGDVQAFSPELHGLDPLGAPLVLNEATIGDYLDNALLAEPAMLVNQYEGVGIVTHFLTARDGQGAVEFRGWGPYPIGISEVPGVIEPLGEMLADRESRARLKHEWAVADGGRANRDLLRAARLLSDTWPDPRATAFSALRNELTGLQAPWRRRHADSGEQLFAVADVATVMVGLHAVQEPEVAFPDAVENAAETLERLRARLDQLRGDRSGPVREAAQRTLGRIDDLVGVLQSPSSIYIDGDGLLLDALSASRSPSPDPEALWAELVESASGPPVPAALLEDAARAAERLGEEQPEVRGRLLAEAGMIVAVDHEPLPVDMADAPPEWRAVYEGVVQLVAARLADDGRSGAETLSSALADELGSRRRTGGPPPGASRPPVDLLEIGGGGGPSGLQAEDVPVEAVSQEQETLPSYVDAPASPGTVSAMAELLGVDAKQTDRLSRYSWFDAEQFEGVRDQVGADEAPRLAFLIERIGRIPDDMEEIADRLAPLGARDVYRLSREFGIDPRHLEMFGARLGEVSARSDAQGPDLVRELRDDLQARYAPAGEIADFVTLALRAGVGAEDMRRVTQAQANQRLTLGHLLRMEPDELLDRVDAALRAHMGNAPQTLAERAIRIVHEQMPGDLLESQSGKVPDDWFDDAVRQVEAVLSRTEGDFDDRLRWAANRARRLVALRPDGADRPRTFEPSPDLDTGEMRAVLDSVWRNEGLAEADLRQLPPDHSAYLVRRELAAWQEVADRLAPMSVSEVAEVSREFGIDPARLWVLGDGLRAIYARPRAEGVTALDEVRRLFARYSADIPAFVSVAVRAGGLDAEEMRAVLDSLGSPRRRTALGLNDLRGMATNDLMRVVAGELSSWQEVADRLAPMRVPEVAEVSREFRIDPARLVVFGDELRAIYAGPRTEGVAPLDDVRRLFADYSPDIRAFVSVAVRAGGLGADDTRAVLDSIQRSTWLREDDLRRLPRRELMRRVQEALPGAREDLEHVREVANRLAPMTVGDVMRVRRTFAVEAEHLGVFGDELRAIYGRPREDREPLEEVRRLFAEYTAEAPFSGDVSAFAQMAAETGFSARDTRAVVDAMRRPGFASRELTGIEDLVAAMRDELTRLREAAGRLAPMTVDDVARVAREYGIDPAHLWVFGDELRAIHAGSGDAEARWREIAGLFAAYASHDDLAGFAAGLAATRAAEPLPDSGIVPSLRAAGLTAIADHLDAGGLPQIQLTEGLRDWMESSEGGHGPLREAMDRLITSVEIRVLDADGRLVSAAGDADAAVERFLIDADGRVSGPFAPVEAVAPAGDDAWRKSSHSTGPYCVEVAVIDTPTGWKTVRS